jgi:hypothetical protein
MLLNVVSRAAMASENSIDMMRPAYARLAAGVIDPPMTQTTDKIFTAKMIVGDGHPQTHRRQDSG